MLMAVMCDRIQVNDLYVDAGYILGSRSLRHLEMFSKTIYFYVISVLTQFFDNPSSKVTAPQNFASPVANGQH
jgi:hypothetical protein